MEGGHDANHILAGDFLGVSGGANRRSQREESLVPVSPVSVLFLLALRTLRKHMAVNASRCRSSPVSFLYLFAPKQDGQSTLHFSLRTNYPRNPNYKPPQRISPEMFCLVFL